MVNNFFKSNIMTDNSNFVGNIDNPKIVYKAHVQGKKGLVIQLINNILNGTDTTPVNCKHNESEIVSTITQSNIFHKCLPNSDNKESSSHDMLNNIHFDQYKEVDNACLLSFYVGEIFENGWKKLATLYPGTKWIVDEYEECWYLDSSMVEYNFKGTNILYNNGNKTFYRKYSADRMDTLLENHPIHFGCIKLEELKRNREYLLTRVDRYQKGMADERFQTISNSFKQLMTTSFLILQRDLNRIEQDIDFIKNMWMTLNEQTYSNEDADLSLKFRYIDSFSPICDINLTLFENNDYR